MFSIFKKAVRMIQMARLESELRSMSDRTLTDIGVDRSEIPEVVRAVFAPIAQKSATVANSNSSNNSSMAA